MMSRPAVRMTAALFCSFAQDEVQLRFKVTLDFSFLRSVLACLFSAKALSRLNAFVLEESFFLSMAAALE